MLYTFGRVTQSGGTNFAYSNAYYVEGEGMMFMHTKYHNWFDRTVNWVTSTPVTNEPSGYKWSKRHLLASVENGHYLSSAMAPDGKTIGTSFNLHPTGQTIGDSTMDGVDSRTNLYYVETVGLSGQWTTADGTEFIPGGTTREDIAPALVHDYASEGKLVYLKSTQFDIHRKPILLYLTSTDFRPGQGGPRQWHTAHWNGREWDIRDIAVSDDNYDYGSLIVEDIGDGGELWRLIAPLAEGPQAAHTGGGMQMLVSDDQGDTWQLIHDFGELSDFNHTYARSVMKSDDDFVALWADGDLRELSVSSLYFNNRDGTAVYRLPYEFEGEWAAPELVYQVPEAGAAAILGQAP